MVGIPTVLVVVFILLPTIASIVLSFTSWNGIGGLEAIEFIGLKNYTDLFTIYKPFWPAVSHNIIWLVFFLVIATPLGMFLAVLLDKNIRGTRIYQSALYMPVVLSLAIVASSGSSSTPLSRGSSTTSSGGPSRGTRSRGWATRASTCGLSSSRRAGARSAT
jgi:ABC-type polysaccharide transport system permease subunit